MLAHCVNNLQNLYQPQFFNQSFSYTANSPPFNPGEDTHTNIAQTPACISFSLDTKNVKQIKMPLSSLGGRERGAAH